MQLLNCVCLRLPGLLTQPKFLQMLHVSGCQQLLLICTHCTIAHTASLRQLPQVCGCQRLLLVSPQYAFKGMYSYPVHHPYDGYSMVDLQQPDLTQWPNNEHVKGLCCILTPGDVLYLPAYW